MVLCKHCEVGRHYSAPKIDHNQTQKSDKVTHSMVLKPRPNRVVQPEKSESGLKSGFLSIENWVYMSSERIG